VGQIYKRGNRWWIKYYRDGRAFRESSGSEVYEDAKTLLKTREGDIAKGVPVNPKVGRVTLGELAEDVYNDYRVNGYKTLKEIENRLGRHVLGFFGAKRRASTVTTADLDKFVVHRQAEGASNAEVNRELTSLRRAFSLATQHDPPKLIRKPRFRLLKEAPPREGFFEPEELASVLRHLPDYFRGPVRFMYATGWRLQETLGLEWRQVDFREGWIRLEAAGGTKRADSRTFPFTVELRELLEERKAAAAELRREHGTITPWVFWRGRKGRRLVAHYKSWKEACRKAGIPGRLVHDFRRTAVRNLVRAGVPEKVAMQMTGHKTRTIFERYNITDERDFRRAAELLDRAAGTIAGTIGDFRETSQSGK
jgi:integrase